MTPTVWEQATFAWPASVYLTIKSCRDMRAAPNSMLGVSADDNIGVTADSEVVVGRRRTAIEPTCSVLAHSAQAALLALGVGPAMVAGAMISHRRERNAQRPRLLFNLL